MRGWRMAMTDGDDGRNEVSPSLRQSSLIHFDSEKIWEEGHVSGAFF